MQRKLSERFQVISLKAKWQVTCLRRIKHKITYDDKEQNFERINQKMFKETFLRNSQEKFLSFNTFQKKRDFQNILENFN